MFPPYASGVRDVRSNAGSFAHRRCLSAGKGYPLQNGAQFDFLSSYSGF
jgi:hypothetical protein